MSHNLQAHPIYLRLKGTVTEMPVRQQHPIFSKPVAMHQM